MIDAFLGRFPRLGDGVYVSATAAVIGDVTLGDGASVWFGASLRGDVHWIEVGAGSNVQDNATVHVSRGTHPCRIGCHVTIGHNAVVHGCTIEDSVLIGMGAVVLDGAVVGAGSLVGAGALVTGGTVIPPASLVVGAPARVARPLTADEVARNRANAEHYVRMSAIYRGQPDPGPSASAPRRAEPAAGMAPAAGAEPAENPFYTDERPTPAL